MWLSPAFSLKLSCGFSVDAWRKNLLSQGIF
jgi:hypothetical protein